MAIIYFICILIGMLSYQIHCCYCRVDLEKIAWWESVIKPYVEKCTSETNVDRVYVEGMQVLEFPNEDKFRCYVKCLYQNIGVLDSKGNINVNEVSKKLTFNHLDQAEFCKMRSLPHSNLCERAYQLLLCIVSFASDSPPSTL
ncbi:hypothetical protein RI129_002106 [Pyrocoelia pectoralis]|uniref:Uncharacterized protein n=1 Tax=Pyrocoelia pectoralis TaxID=417401 RepID=A0AAN7VII9_9COLE